MSSVGADHYDFETVIRIGKGVWRDKLLVIVGASAGDHENNDELNNNKKNSLIFIPGRISKFHYWLATILLMTVPYRHWFANQCDLTTVQFVKETYQRGDGLDASLAAGKTGPPQSSRFSSAIGSYLPKTKFFRAPGPDITEKKQIDEVDKFIVRLKQELGDGSTASAGHLD